MGLVYYLRDGTQYANRDDVPPDETVMLLKSLYIKKEKFRLKANHSIDWDKVTIEGNPYYENNSVTLHSESKSYYCDEYTYYNSILADYERLRYDDLRGFTNKHRKMTLEIFKSFSRPLKREERDSRRKDLGKIKGYRGDKLNTYGCLLKMLEDIPEGTLIESKTNYYSNVGELFEFIGDIKPTSFICRDEESHIHRLEQEAEYEVFQVLASKIQNVCEEKNIYFDVNPYALIKMYKEPIETWIATKDVGYDHNIRHSFMKFEDTYIDGHVSEHEEATPIEIVEREYVSRRGRILDRKHEHVIETYDVTYVDGVKDRITKEYIDRD